jgi:hypothetical protein
LWFDLIILIPLTRSDRGSGTDMSRGSTQEVNPLLWVSEVIPLPSDFIVSIFLFKFFQIFSFTFSKLLCFFLLSKQCKSYFFVFLPRDPDIFRQSTNKFSKMVTTSNNYSIVCINTYHQTLVFSGTSNNASTESLVYGV